MNKLFPVNLRKINNSTFANDNYSLSTDQSILARTTPVSATGTCTTTVATINMYNHGYIVGDVVPLVGTGVFNGNVTVTGVNQDNFTYTVSTTAVTTPVNLTVTVTTLEVNEYIGTEAPLVLTITQTLAALELAAPAGSCYPVTVVGTKANTVIVAPADTSAYPALLFTAKTVNIRKVVDSTISVSAVRSTTTVTVTATNHGYLVGQYFTLATIASGGEAMLGTYAIATVADANTFTYTTTTSGTITAKAGTGYHEYSKIFQYKEGARNILYLVNEPYANILPFTYDSFSSTTATLSTGPGVAETDTIANSAALVGQKVIGVVINAYSGTLNTNGIPVVTEAVVSSAGVITLTILNAHGTNALSGTLTVTYFLTN